MEASTRVLRSFPSLTRHLFSKRFLLLSLRNPNPRPLTPPQLPSCHRHRHGFTAANCLSPRNPFLSLSSPSPPHSLSSPSSPPIDRHDLDLNNANGSSPLFDRARDASNRGDLGFPGEKAPTWTVVLLGWLGAEEKHLKRYAEMYNAKGIRAVRFVVPVKETIGFDLGKNVEERIDGLARELARWCAESEKDGKERHLIFHTFSNTGWLM